MSRLFSTTALLTGMIVSVSAHAQTSPLSAEQSATEQQDLEDTTIIVTAQKRSENIQDVPIAISAINSTYLDRRGIASIDQLGSIAPNTKVERAPATKTISQVSIRGSVTINPAITWEPAVGLYLNGVYIAKAQGSLFDVVDLERVEILRGPQGTLYGRNALAGAVNLVPKQPTGELSGLIEVGYGNFNNREIRGSLNLPKVGPFSIKLSGKYRRRDGIIDIEPNSVPGVPTALPPRVSRTDSVGTDNIMLQVHGDLSEDLELDYTFDYNNIDQTPPFAQLLRVNRNGDPRDIFDPGAPGYAFGGAFFPLDRYTKEERVSTASIDPLVYEKSRTSGHAVALTADVGTATIKSITAYRTLDFKDAVDLDGTPLPVAFSVRDTDYHAFSQELQATGTALNERLNYVVGLFYFREKGETINPQSYFGGGQSFQSAYGSHTKAYAAYAQIDLRIADPLKLTLGARYTRETKDIMRFLQVVSSPTLPSGILPLTVADIAYGEIPDAKYKNFSPAATLSYELSDRVNTYVRFARGFKSGGFNGETNEFGAPTADCPSGALELCNPYKPERVDSYELGIKTRLLDNRLTLNAAAFWDEHKDIQLAIFQAVGAGSSIIRNAAAARIRGLEIEAIARPSQRLVVNTSFAYLDADYKRYIDAGVDVSRNRSFPHTPKYTISTSADWQVIDADWGKVNLVGDLNFVSAYFTYPYPLVTASPSDQNAFNTRSPGRSIVNLRAVVSDLRLGALTTEVSVWVRNLTRERSPSNFIDFGPSFGGLTVGYFPDPRTYGITARAAF